MTLVAIKQGNKTIYKRPEDIKDDGTDDITGRDLTTSGAAHVALGISKERYAEIFGIKNNGTHT